MQLKDHELRELVNELRDIALKYRDTQQLRAKIAHCIKLHMEARDSE